MRLASALFVVSLAGCSGGDLQPDAPPDFGDLRRDEKQAIDLLRELIRFDTINPPEPGSPRKNANETALLMHVKGILAADGIDADLYESERGRGNLVARYRGTGERRPLLLMAHVDVVNVDRSQWEVDPLSAAVRDGFIWGRGALDDKDDAAVFIQVMRLLARRKVKLKRDVLLMLNGDEESSGKYGAAWMVEKHWDAIECEFALSEGGRASLKDGKVVEYGFETAEKVYNDFRVWVRGQSGHSSVPIPRNAIYDAARMLEKLERFTTPVRLIETTRESLEAVSELPAYAPWKDLMKKAAAGDLKAAEDLCKVPRFNAQLRSTFVPTMVRGGIRENVLPPDVEVNFNARLLPGDRIDDLIKALMEQLELPKYELVRADAGAIEKWKVRNKDDKELPVAVFVSDWGVDAPATSTDTDMYRALVAVAKRLTPGAVVGPRLTPGATDMRFLRTKGVQCYGIAPCPVGEEEESTPHGHNERVRVESVRFGVRWVLEAVLEVCR